MTTLDMPVTGGETTAFSRARSTSLVFGTAIILTLGIVGCESESSQPDTDPALEAVDLAAEHMAGSMTMGGLQGFQIEATGTRYITGESVAYDDPAMEVSTFTSTVSADLARDTLRIDYQRDIELVVPIAFTYSEVYNGELGYIDGIESLFGTGNAAMLSSRWASGRKQNELLNPHLLIREALADPSLISFVGFRDDGGKIFFVIEIADDIRPIELWIAKNGRIARAVTQINDFARRDSQLEVLYDDWRGSKIAFPHTVTVKLHGELLHVENRQSVVVNPELGVPGSADDIFAIPEDAMATFNADDARWGQETQQFFQQFASIGVPLDFRQETVVAVPLAEGVWHLTGGSHHSMAVEQEDGVVIVEAPLHPERGDAILAWVATELEKPVTHVIATHHHDDHAGGLRSFVAAGVTVVARVESEPYYRQNFAAPSTIVRDALSRQPTEPALLSLASHARLTLDDPERPIEILPLPNTHAEDMLLIHVPTAAGSFVFESDMYNPGGGGFSILDVLAVELRQGIESLGVDPATVTLVGGHGATSPVAELDAYIELISQ